MLFVKYRKLFLRKVYFFGQGAKKIVILVTRESLILHSLVLFQNQTEQYKSNLTNLNYVYGYLSVRPHLKTTFSDLSQQKKLPEKI